MNRYWVSWWSGYYKDEGCTTPPFQIWISGQKARSNTTEKDDCSICAVIDANNENEIWPVIKKHFPDYEPRFCSLRENDFNPGDRFQDFKNKTSLVTTQ